VAHVAEEIRWYKETVPGEKPLAPDNFLLRSADGYTVQETENSEEIIPIGASGEPGGKAYGASTYGGNVDMTLVGDMFPMLAHHAIGEATTKDDAATDTWAGTTVQAVGDLVNHSDGTHTLYCQTAGTTGSTEPDITSLNEYQTVNDGTVTWVVRDKLISYKGKRESCLDTFGLELKLAGSCSGGSDVFERVGGCYINTVEFGKSAGDISLKASIAILGMNMDSSVTNPSYPPQDGSDAELSSEYIGNCDLDVYIDGVQMANLTSLKAPINRNITMDQTLICGENISNIGNLSIAGTVEGLFTEELYGWGVDKSQHELKLVYTHKGDLMELTFPRIVFDKNPIGVVTQKSATISGGFTAIGDKTQSAVSYKVVSRIDY